MSPQRPQCLACGRIADQHRPIHPAGGHALAVWAESDARFNGEFAEATGYVPRSILATPLLSGERVIGVMEVLDKIDGASFGMQDMELLGIFAAQAALAIDQSQQIEAIGEALVLVSAVNNLPEPSYPSLYSSVISVAAHEGRDPFLFYYNPAPPVEFGAPGIDVQVAWKDKQYLVCTGNSFAAPHIAGIVTLIRAKHPDLTPFQIKTVLWACAANTRRA